MAFCQRASLVVLIFASCSACPETWTSVNDIKCIKLFPQAASHDEAIKVCQGQEAELLKIEDATQWRTVADIVSEGQYRPLWTDDREPFFGNGNGWCSLYIGQAKEATCPVYLMESGKVKLCDGHCSNEYLFACQKPFQSGQPSPPATGYSCPVGFISWGSHCYRPLAGKHSWPVECSNLYGDAVDLKPQSKAEENFLRNTLDKMGYGDDVSIWIWASCNRTKCSFRDGRPTFHDKVNFEKCNDKSYGSVYWNLTTDEWNCAPSFGNEYQFNSVCKMDGEPLQEDDIPTTNEPGVQVESTSALAAPVYLNLWQILFDFI
ncbi:hypothetical protein HDE_06070 [Halotydeus destructor]|nr:hypothetical protein HDE_06070 [Halotydeus destructor]